MWFREYRNYKTDEANIKNRIEPNHGIYGCEMHEIYGWGTTLQRAKNKKKSGIVKFLLRHFFGRNKEVI
jgi:hypothetical protein